MDEDNVSVRSMPQFPPQPCGRAPLSPPRSCPAPARPPPPAQYAVAHVGDVPAIRALYDESFPIRYDGAFYKLLAEGIKSGALPGKPGRSLVCVAKRRGAVVGAVVLHTLNLAEARREKQLTFDVLQQQDPTALAAYVMLLAVDRGARREGIATELVWRGVRALVQQQLPIGAVFLHTLADELAGNELYESMHYTLLGAVPGHYSIDGVARDAHVWALALGGGALCEYAPAAPGGVPDLTRAALVHARRTPPWVRAVCLQLVLPVAAVVVMFVISYALVVSGPLRGVSRRMRGLAGSDDAEEL